MHRKRALVGTAGLSSSARLDKPTVAPEIDRLVEELCGLTYEEIAIVEEATR